MPSHRLVQPIVSSTTMNVQLGGVWAHMREESSEQLRRISELEHQVSYLEEELSSRGTALDAYDQKLQFCEATLKATTENRDDVYNTMNAERLHLHEQNGSLKTKLESAQELISKLQDENARFSRQAAEAVESEKSATREKDNMLSERDRTDEELRILGDRVESIEQERDELAKQLANMEVELKKTQTQRDNHCAHAELLLKEKNRYGAELAKMKREAMAVQDENTAPQNLSSGKKYDNGKMKQTKAPSSARRTAKETGSIEAERDLLRCQVRELEQSKEALVVRFRAASESRLRLEKSLKSIKTPPPTLAH